MKESRTDIIDLIIHVLQEHEKSLDETVNSLNSLYEKMACESLSYSQAQNVIKVHTKSLLDSTNNLTNIEIYIKNYVQELYNMNLIKENWIDSLIEKSMRERAP